MLGLPLAALRARRLIPGVIRLPFAEKSLLNLAAFGIVVVLRR